MAGYVIAMLVASGLTLVAALVAMWRRVLAGEFYRLATLAMCAPFGAALSAGSWFAIIPGFIAAFWAVMAWTEPPRRRRHQALARTVRALQQGEPPR